MLMPKAVLIIIIIIIAQIWQYTSIHMQVIVMLTVVIKIMSAYIRHK